MAQLPFESEPPVVAAEVLDRNLRGIWRIEAISPLDDYGSLIEQLLEAEVTQLPGRFEPVQVDMRQLNATLVDANQLEGRASHQLA